MKLLIDLAATGKMTNSGRSGCAFNSDSHNEAAKVAFFS